ncbi:MAG TPA: phenylalanine--tRNA ligase subunit beta [Candidatus Saccharimonadales bacterium]
MKISTAALHFINKHYGSAGDPMPDGIDSLVRVIGSGLAGIDEIINFGDRFDGVLVAKIVSCEDHPNADRLHVCKIDDGGAVQGIERDENGHVQVVCGAPNARAGITVAWLPPGATVPNTFDSDPFVLESRALRGVMSNGMLASPKELSFGDGHEGILEINEDIAPGTPFADAFHLRGDFIIDMENKMFTHRPDCFGWLGVAREIEGIHHRPYKSPEWYQINPDFPAPETEELKLDVQNELPDLVPRFTAVVLRDVQVKESPMWLQADLARMGVRSINNIVDYTNFFMIETGQPLHAYDYDKVRAQDADHATIVVRHPKAGEKITLLNGKEIAPRPEAIMIATRDRLIGIGGVMGGADTEVDENTRNIIIEAANFDMYSIRRTSMAHGLFTDAVTRFNKGQSPLQTKAVVAKIVDEIRHYAEGKVAGVLIDDIHLPAEVIERGSLHEPVTLASKFINERLGVELSSDEIAVLLTNVEFDVQVSGDDLRVKAPFWRTDIAIPEDIVEEVGRLYGYDRLPLELPARDLTPAKRDTLLTLKGRIRGILSGAGANELLTYSFVHGNLLQKVDQDPGQAFQLSNALSPDLQYFRMSLLPSLLEKVHPNLKSGHKEFVLYEMGKGHNLLHAADDDGLPTEFEMLALVFATDDKVVDIQAGAAFYRARAYLMHLAERLGVNLVFVPVENNADAPIMMPYDLQRSAFVQTDSGVFLGVIGEFKSSVRSSLKLPRHVAGFEIGLRELADVAGRSPYKTLPRFPRIEQDICLKVSSDVPYQTLYDLVGKTVDGVKPKNTWVTVTPVDIYQRQDDQVHKQITLRLSLASYERTLTDAEVGIVLDHVADAAKTTLQAERI